MPPVSFIKMSAKKAQNKTAFSSTRAWIKRWADYQFSAIYLPYRKQTAESTQVGKKKKKFKSQRWLWSEGKIGTDGGSLPLTDWFKVTKVVTLENSILQCWQSRRVEAQQRTGCSIIYFSSCFCWAEYLEVSSVSRKMKQCWISKRYAAGRYFKVLPFSSVMYLHRRCLLWKTKATECRSCASASNTKVKILQGN